MKTQSVRAQTFRRQASEGSARTVSARYAVAVGFPAAAAASAFWKSASVKP